ncbi:MAG: ThuA domain-containing protein [Cyclobacteriaceae bacterium]|nr:ThuA domain-containing protein [Cyclobacteriaceae bacterium]
MTKNIIYLLIGFLLFNCQGNKTENQTDLSSEEVQEINDPELWKSYQGSEGAPEIVLISGDEEYRSEETLPQLAKILAEHHGFNCTVLFAQDPAKPGVVNPNYANSIPGLEALESADLMIIATRFRALPDSQMVKIDNYLKSGRPVIGLRTATHAFNFKDSKIESGYTHYGNYHESDDEWNGGFGRLVLGEKWISHHGHHKHQSTRGIFAEDQENHAIFNGIDPGSVWGPTDVYGVRLPLSGDAVPLLLGQVTNRKGEYDENDVLFGMRITDDEVAGEEEHEGKMINKNNPMMPVAWTKSYQLPNGKKGKVFATTMGSSTDMLTEGTRRMVINSVFWCLDLDVPEKANVDLIGAYEPSAYSFKEDSFWIEKKIVISEIK